MNPSPFAAVSRTSIRSNVAHILCGVTSLVIATSAVGRAAAQEAPQTVTDFQYAEVAALNGAVFSDSGEPIEGARIQFGGIELRTNIEGGWRARVRPGVYIVHVDAAGFTSPAAARVVLAPGKSAELVVTLYRDGAAASVDQEGGEELKADVDSASAPEERGPPGEIRGHVSDEEAGQPISRVRVYVRGLPVEGETDDTGNFVLELPPGTFDLSLIHPEYSSQSVAQVEVKSKETTEIDAEMVPAALTLDSFVVYIPRIEGSTAALLEERKDASTMNEVIGAEQFSKAGDSSAASALKRVTGLTVVGGKYAYIRGLGDRYSATLLNGSTLPSPEPDKRVVPLDLFPTALLESVTIQKTYSPDMPGGFGGGVIKIETRSFPKTFQASLSLGAGYQSGTTFRDVFFFDGGKFDWLGVDDGTRRLPREVRDAADDRKLIEKNRFSAEDEGYTPEELEALGEAMPETWGTHRKLLPPSFGVSGTVGNSFELLGKPSGALFALTYSNSWSFDDEYSAVLRVTETDAGPELSVKNTYDFEDATNNIVIGGIFATGLELDRNNAFKFTSMINRITDNESRFFEGFNRDAGTQILVRRARWLERQLLYEQLRGEHTLPGANDLRIDWRYVYARASMLEPDRRATTYEYQASIDAFALSQTADGNSRLFSELVDHNHDVGFDVTRPFTFNSLTAKLTSGASFVLKDREVDTRRYKLNDQEVLLDQGDDVLALEPSQLFIDERIGPNQGFRFLEVTLPTDNYTARQLLTGAYASAALPFSEQLTVSGGVRFEYSSQSVSTFELFTVTPQVVEANVAKLDVLPALNATYKLGEKQQLRAAFARTVNRPDFRELSPSQFKDVVGGVVITGNPELERAAINHADVRWEYYPEVGESMSASMFYKLFQDPIEPVIIPGATTLQSYINVPISHLAGVEFEARRSLGVFRESLRDFFVSGNLALMYSQVIIPEDDERTRSLTSKRRPAQGMSPYVLNAQLGYEPVEKPLTMTLLYNVFGPRIDTVGAQQLPDYYERPFNQLDFVASYKATDRVKVGFKAKNLLDSTRYIYGLDTKTYENRPGRSFSLSAGAKF